MLLNREGDGWEVPEYGMQAAALVCHIQTASMKRKMADQDGTHYHLEAAQTCFIAISTPMSVVHVITLHMTICTYSVPPAACHA